MAYNISDIYHISNYIIRVYDIYTYQFMRSRICIDSALPDDDDDDGGGCV